MADPAVEPSEPDWEAAIDAWTERFRDVADPPEPFATALREGWSPEARSGLAEDAASYHTRMAHYVAELRAAGVETVRLDVKNGCGVCERYHASCYRLGEDGELPPPPPLPICPACRHTLNMLTPFFLQSTGLSMDELVATSVPFTPPA